MTEFDLSQSFPVRVGLVGTGFVAKVRSEAFAADERSRLQAVTGHRLDKAEAFAREHGIAQVMPSWEALVQSPDIDLVVVCTINNDHGQVVRAALAAGKSVVVEYPLSLSATEAAALITLAREKRRLLHVEHIELLGGLHQAVRSHLPKIGQPHYVRYCTAVPQRPTPTKWTYDARCFGFPLAGALSRVHRLTNLFGPVETVACQIQYDEGGSVPPIGAFKHCRCVAQLQFRRGVMAEVLYAKGESTWRSQRGMEIEGDRGALVFDGNQGTLINEAGESPIEVGSRRGLFAQDTGAVLDALLEGTPLYVTPAESLYALQVAAMAEQSAATGQTIRIRSVYPGDIV